jgi:hypothetical protein
MEDVDNSYRIGTLAFLRYLSIVLLRDEVIERPLRHDKTIDSFSESQCWTIFGIRKPDLTRLLKGLRFPQWIKLENRSKMSGEEVMLRGLYELVSGEDQHTISENVFGRDFSQQSRAFKWFVDHIYSTFLDLMQDNLTWWFESGFMHRSAEAIKEKLASLGLLIGDDEFQVAGFIDCNCLETCRVGGGPQRAGPGAARWDNNIQRAFYNGWKSIHGLKHQTFDNAYGITMDMHGPTSLRRNDLRLLGHSQLNRRLAELGNNTNRLGAYGDSIYPHLSHISSSWRTPNNTPRQVDENNGYKSVRISIEWNYMVTGNIFGYIKNLNKLRLMDGVSVCKVYTVATFLRNCHVCMYGSISQSYFDLLIPENMLEQYLQME